MPVAGSVVRGTDEDGCADVRAVPGATWGGRATAPVQTLAERRTAPVAGSLTAVGAVSGVLIRGSASAVPAPPVADSGARCTRLRAPAASANPPTVKTSRRRRGLR